MTSAIPRDAVRAGMQVLYKRLHQPENLLPATDRFTVHAAFYDIVLEMLCAAEPHLKDIDDSAKKSAVLQKCRSVK